MSNRLFFRHFESVKNDETLINKQAFNNMKMKIYSKIKKNLPLSLIYVQIHVSILNAVLCFRKIMLCFSIKIHNINSYIYRSSKFCGKAKIMGKNWLILLLLSVINKLLIMNEVIKNYGVSFIHSFILSLCCFIFLHFPMGQIFSIILFHLGFVRNNVLYCNNLTLQASL